MDWTLLYFLSYNHNLSMAPLDDWVHLCKQVTHSRRSNRYIMKMSMEQIRKYNDHTIEDIKKGLRPRHAEIMEEVNE